MVSIFEAIIEIVIIILMLVLGIYFLIKEIKDILKFHIYTWHLIFDKDKGLSKDINKIKADFIKMRKLLKSRMEQKKQREIWNKALEKN